MTIIVTGASIAAMQAQRTQEGDTLRGKPQADWENSCPRSPATNMGSTTKQQKITCKQNKKKNIQQSHHDMYATHHARRLLDGRASDTVPGDKRQV